MSDLYVLDNCVDDREFRNIVLSRLLDMGVTKWKLDDERLSDNDPDNDNDFIVELNGTSYTIQTFLNTEITKKEVDETIQDVFKENVAEGILITNTIVIDEMKDYGKAKGVQIWDRSFFE